jgi:hypothetical protein
MGLTIPSDHIMVSLDVVLLFTCIPSKLVIHVVNERWNETRRHSSLPQDEFLKGLEYLMNNCIFPFESRIYKQISGLP